MPLVVHPLVQQRLEELRRLCAHLRVRRLELFGSATSSRFDPATSDLDFLVEFAPQPGGGYADAYFGLLEALERLFDRKVDLVVGSAIKNPYFRESVDKTKALLYAA